jgi:deoxycytidine triphosphate deaminase
MSILSSKGIKKFFQAGYLKIDPYCDEQLNPASYDVRLDRVWGFYKDANNRYITIEEAVNSKQEYELKVGNF